MWYSPKGHEHIRQQNVPLWISLSELVETTKHASKTFWELHKKSGHTYRTFVLELKRLSKRFAFAETYEEVSDKFVLEKFSQDLAPEQQAYVREREPKTALEAADTAANYLSIHGLDQTKADYSKPWTLRPNYTKDNSSAPKKKWQDKPWWKGKPYRADNHNTKTPTNIPLKKIDAETTCGALMEIFARFGVPEEILTDID